MGVLMMLSVLGLPLLLAVLFVGIMTHRRIGKLSIFHWGQGLVLGLLVPALMLQILNVLGLPFSRIAVTGACLIALAPMAWIYRRTSGIVAPIPPGDRPGMLERLAWMVMIALLALHVVPAAWEALTRPVSAWDATMHWATKARVWFEAGEIVPFFSYEEWLREPAPTGYTDFHPDYPSMIPLLQVWVAVAIDRWSEVLINLPWPLMMLSLAPLMFAAIPAKQRLALAPLAFAYLLLSLPLLNANVALAGLADLFLGVLLCAMIASSYRALTYGETHQWLFCLLFALGSLATKREGLFWVAAVAAATGWTLLPSLRLRITAAAVAGAVALLAPLLLPKFELSGDSLTSLELYYRPDAARALLARTFDTWDWHLGVFLWLSALPIMLVAGPRDRGTTAIAASLVLLLSAYIFLFTCTLYSRAVLNGTGSGRLLMQLAPALTFFSLLTWQRISSAVSSDAIRSDA